MSAKKKTTKKTRAAASNVSKVQFNKALKDRDAARKKWRDAIASVKKLKKAFTAKLAAKAAELRNKVKEAEARAHSAATSAFEKAHAGKEAAKQKIVQAAIAKFEKSHAKKAGKKTTTKARKAKPAAKKAKAAKATKPAKATKSAKAPKKAHKKTAKAAKSKGRSRAKQKAASAAQQ